MISISQILDQTDPHYLKYVSKKTDYLIRNREEKSLYWLWYQILRNFDFDFFFNHLSLEEKEAFFLLLNHFGYIPSRMVSKPLEDIEKKATWILKDPEEGYFIPLEIFKKLMKQPVLLNKNFLFSLICRLKLSDQKTFGSLIGCSDQAQLSISFERNSLDMALVLYIWFANFHKNDKKDEVSQVSNKKVFTSNPALLWIHLYEKLPRFKNEIREWQKLMEYGEKNFFRSLSLLSGSGKTKELLAIFQKGYLIPILDKNFENKRDIHNILVVTPREVYFNEFVSK